ncbi:hypothetical protein GCM10020255_075200 [Rhodococcus baikonurensis]
MVCKSVRDIRIEAQVDVVACRRQPCHHGEILGQDHVVGSDDNEGRGQAAQVSEGRRNIRDSAITDMADVGFDEVFVADGAAAGV